MVDASALACLPDEVFSLVLGHLAEADLLRCAASCRALRETALSEAVWQPRVRALLQDKHFALGTDVHDAESAACCPCTDGFRDTSVYCFFANLKDAARTTLRKEELSGLEFCFRFKAAAGAGGWIDRDPWWNGQEAPRLKLCPDGTVRPLNEAHPFWGSPGQIAGGWKFVAGAQCDQRDIGSAVKISGHSGSPRVRRHPHHWGVFLEADWCVFTGFAMQPRGAEPEMEDEALRASSAAVDAVIVA